MTKSYLIFSKGWNALPLAKRLKNSGGDVIIGSDTPTDGFKTIPSQKLLDALKKVKNPDDYTIYTDEEMSKDLINQGFNDIMIPKERRDAQIEKATELIKDEYNKKYTEEVKKIKDSIKNALYGTD